jgi:hypothetical protein
MGSVLNENKRVNVTESDVQARYLAENGLTYFVNAFNNYVSKTEPSNVNIDTFLKDYQTFIPIDSNKKDETNIIAAPDKDDPDIINVTSIGNTGKSKKTLIGRYKLGFGPPVIIGDFTGKAIDFSTNSLANVQLLKLVDLDVLNPTGSAQEYYKVPYGISIGVNVPIIINLNIGSDPFETMREYEVVATRGGQLLGAGIIKNIINITLFDFKDEPDTNVLINGYYPPAINVLGLISTGPRYDDITFLKLGVLGNTVIQQDIAKDHDSIRSFSFVNGLYVNKSLVIGGSSSGRSNLRLHGNMVSMGNLYINNVNLKTGDKSNKEATYVKGDAEITDACINKNGDANSDFQLYAEGKITFKVDRNTDCKTFNGFFYAEKGIEVQTDGNVSTPAVTINGGIVGKILTPEKINYVPNPIYVKNVKLTYNKLIPLGRKFD